MSRITAIETAIPAGMMPDLLLVRTHTDDGLVGCGETYYTPQPTSPRSSWPSDTRVLKLWPFDRVALSEVKLPVDTLPVIEQGIALLPEGPGLGMRLHDSHFGPGVNESRRSSLR